MHRVGLFFAVVLLSTTTLFGASQKTPWGDPDLQGIWSNQSPTPLERRDALAGKLTLTEEEAAASVTREQPNLDFASPR